jgi:DNA transposition AAA+ family ATPase
VIVSYAIEHIIFDVQILVELSIFKKEEIPWKERIKKRVKLIIIDEADRLRPKSLEQVRDIYGRQAIAIILIGMPGIEKRLIRSPQLYSRIGFSHVYKPLSKDEIAFIIQNHLKLLNASIDSNSFSDQEAIATFSLITQGNFRLINRLLKQTIRIMEVNQSTHITKEIIEAARECLVIGNLH